MYSPQRTQWWHTRSQEPGHQVAYRQIALCVLGDPENILDAGCGNGDLLLHLYSPSRALVGTDTSMKSLRIAHLRFVAAGIPVYYSGPSQIQPRTGAIVLAQDNIVSSELPDDVFDVTLFTFPELGTKYPLTSLEQQLVQKHTRRFGACPDHSRDLGITERANFHLLRTTKVGGHLMTSLYERQYRNHLERAVQGHVNTREFAEYHGCALKQYTFFENREVWEDTEIPLEEYERGGFRLITQKKLSSLYPLLA